MAEKATLKALPKKESGPQKSGLQTLWAGISKKAVETYTRAGRVYTRAQPYIEQGTNAVWAIGTTALLLALPILIEVQRETTVLVLQRQREQEIHDMQESLKAQQGGMLENMKGLMGLAAGAGGAAPGQQ